MQIRSLTVKNFRSIESVEISPSGFNVFVGQNNHGKTNFFDAIEWFFNGARGSVSDLRRRGTQEAIEVEVVFSNTAMGLSAMRNPTAGTKLQPFINSQDEIKIRRRSDEESTRKFEIFNPITEAYEALKTGMDASLLDLLPKFEYVKTETNLKDIAKYGKTTPIGEMLSGVLSVILEANPKYRDFRTKFEELFGGNDSEVKVQLDTLSGKVKIYLEKQFPDCTAVEFEVKEPAFDDLLKNFETKVDDGIKTYANEKGDGMQRAIMLAIIQTYADFRKENLAKPFVFLIDEGELHLHPTAQRKLKNALIDLVERGDQVFLNTHSSVLVVDEHSAQSVFTVEKIENITQIEKSDESRKTSIVYDLLGGSPSDLLLPRNFIIVEGESEYEFLSRAIPRLYGYRGIQIIKAIGDITQARRSINAIEKIFSPLEQSLYKTKVVIMLDKLNNEQLSQGSLNEFLRKYSHIKEGTNLFILPFETIEEYYPNATEEQLKRDGSGGAGMPKWKRTTDEVKSMSNKQKVKLAKEVGNRITIEQLEESMEIILKVITTSEANAFQ